MPAERNDTLPVMFKGLALTSLFAQLSEQIALAAAPLVAVLYLGANATQTAYLQSAQTLPFLLFSMPAGLLVDRLSRRNLMLASECLRAVSLFAILYFLQIHHLGLRVLALCGFLGAIGTVVYSVAAPAVITELVDRTQLIAANRWLEIIRSVSFTSGPALGGAIVGWTGGSSAYVMSMGMSLAAALCLVRLVEKKRTLTPRRHVMIELGAGMSYVARHPLLRPLLATAFVFNISWFILQGVFVAYAVESLGFSPIEIGGSQALYGFGMVLGAWGVKGLSRFFSFGTLIVAGPVSAWVASVCVLATIWHPSGLLIVVSFILFGAGPMLWTVTTSALRQAVTPGDMLGRVSAVVMTATAGARPVGALIAAAIVMKFDTGVCLAASTLGFCIQFFIVLMSPARTLESLPAAAAP